MLKMEKTAAVGKRITTFVAAAAIAATELHEIMVQCALHVRDNGDTSLAQRLVDELTNNPDVALKGAAAINVQGVRTWFANACPMTARAGVWKLFDVTSDSYTKYVERMTTDNVKPDDTMGPGKRLFFVEHSADNAFWLDGDVINSQRQNIRVIGVKNVLGMAFAIKVRVEKSIKEGLFAGDQNTVDAFLKQLTTMTTDFEKKHAVELVGEDRAVAALKIKLETPPEPIKDTPDVGGLSLELTEDDLKAEYDALTGDDKPETFELWLTSREGIGDEQSEDPNKKVVNG